MSVRYDNSWKVKEHRKWGARETCRRAKWSVNIANYYYYRKVYRGKAKDTDDAEARRGVGGGQKNYRRHQFCGGKETCTPTWDSQSREALLSPFEQISWTLKVNKCY